MGTIDELHKVMARLRDPDRGCPWDLEQTFDTIAPHTVEEAHEVADAIARRDDAALVDELGDLLFQVVFYAQMGSESGRFQFADIVRAIVDKMVRRHPHVFGDARVEDAGAQSRAWEAIKAAERPTPASRMDALPRGLAPTLRAGKLQRRAASVGFDWRCAQSVLPKLREEVEELALALCGVASREAVEEELGDLLFTCINLARHRRRRRAEQSSTWTPTKHCGGATSSSSGASARWKRRRRPTGETSRTAPRLNSKVTGSGPRRWRAERASHSSSGGSASPSGTSPSWTCACRRCR